MIWNLAGWAAGFSLCALYVMGWVILVGSTFVISHFDLFVLRQVWLHFRGERSTHLRFATPGPYRIVRHPICVGCSNLGYTGDNHQSHLDRYPD